MDRAVNLPRDVFKVIMLKLNPVEILRLCNLNQELGGLCSDEIFWKEVAEKNFPGAQLWTETWHHLVNRLSKNSIVPRKIPVYQVYSTMGTTSQYGYLLLNRSSTLEDLWKICNKLGSQSFGEKEVNSSDIIKNINAYKRSHFIVQWSTRKDDIEMYIQQIVHRSGAIEYSIYSLNRQIQKIFANVYLTEIMVSDFIESNNVVNKSLYESIEKFLRY